MTTDQPQALWHIAPRVAEIRCATLGDGAKQTTHVVVVSLIDPLLLPPTCKKLRHFVHTISSIVVVDDDNVDTSLILLVVLSWIFVAPMSWLLSSLLLLLFDIIFFFN